MMFLVKGFVLYALAWSVVYCYTPAPGFESIEWIPASDIPYPDYEEENSDSEGNFSSDDELDLHGLYTVIDADLKETLERYKVHTRARPWMDAVTECWSEGGYLATPGDTTEAQLLGSVLEYAVTNANITNTKMVDAMHVGVHRLNHKNTWSTVEDEKIMYSKWISNHPKSIDSSDSTLYLQGCAAIMADGRLIQQFCNQKLIYVCERHGPQKREKNSSEKADGYVGGVRGSLLKLHELALAWPAAEDKCEAEGARLAAPRSDREAGRLAGFLLAEGKVTEENWQRGILIGVHNLHRGNFWRNVYGELVYRSSWAPGIQVNDETTNCAAITSTGQFISVRCQEPRIFVCEKRLKVNNTKVYKKVGDVGYFALYPHQRGWISAVAQCRADNASLAVPRSKEEATVLEQIKDEYLKETQSRLFRKIFVGIQDIDGDGQWHTIYGDPLRTSSFKEWNTEYEYSYKNNMLCGGLFLGKFISVPCYTGLISICKKPILS